MKVIFIEKHADGLLDIAIRAKLAGHQALYWCQDYDQHKAPIGRGLVERVRDWREHLIGADLVLLGANDYAMPEFEALKRRGVPVIGGTPESARWESDRAYGMQVFKRAGIAIPEYRAFTDYDEAIRYVKKQDRPFASKPSGHCDDKSLSYVAKEPRDLVYMLERWKRAGKRQGLEFILQEKVSGIEFACGAWFGPGGFANGWEENHEHKKLMAGNQGVNCYSADTEVLTSLGWKAWPSVTPADELATLVDGVMEFERPRNLIVKEHDGEMIYWRSGAVDIAVTPDHAMYVTDRESVKSGELHFSRVPASVVAADTRKSGYAVLRTGTGWAGQDTGISAEHAKLLGMYLADGYARRNSIIFSNCPAHKEPLIRNAALACGVVAHRYGSDLYINSKKFTDMWRSLGKGLDARAPAEIMEAKPQVICAFLEGMALDATTRTDAAPIYTTASRGMANDLQILALKIGYGAIVRERDRRGEPERLLKGYPIRGSLSWDVGLSTRSLAWLRSKFLTRSHYEGKVYCATVSSGVIMVRRNGKACWNGQCGEMGTVMTYTAKSKLADKVLKPLEDQLYRVGFVGNVDVNCIIDDDGNPWPLEFTMRCGWPAFNIEQALFRVDCMEFLAALAKGSPPKDAHYMDECAIGLVLAHGDFPHSHMTRREVVGVPIYDIEADDDDMHFAQVMVADAPFPPDYGREPCLATAGDYVLIATGTGKTVQEARQRAYRAIERPKLPSEPFYRPDIGQRLSRELPRLHEMGFATGLSYS